jgi:quinol monooxygenase YgiN
MASHPDTCCTLAPYFKVAPGQVDTFKRIADIMVAKTRTEPGCVHYAFSFDGDQVHCREGYDDAAALLAHLENIYAPLQEALKIAQITRFEVHAPAAEIEKLRVPLAEKLRVPLADLKPEWFTLESGIRR